MKDITIQLKQFLETNFIKKHDCPISRFSNESKYLLNNLFSLMIKAEHFVYSLDIHSEIIRGNNTPKSYSHSHMPKNILDEIENLDKICHIYTFSIGVKKYQITTVFPTSKKYSNIAIMHRIKKVIMWLYIANHFAPKHCSQKMNVYIYLTDLHKVLPTKHKTIEQEHANTAFTTSCQLVTDITLYREEEWFKVLIHESFHNLGLDFSAHNNNKCIKYILSLFPVNSEVNLFESYCEIWAELMNVMFISYFSFSANVRTIENIDKFINKTEKMMFYENIYSMFQCVKVLHFMGLEYKDLYDNTDKSIRKRDAQYKEKTNVLSYYIIKSIIMFQLNDFLKWCYLHNKGSLNFNNHNKTNDEKILLYCEFIREHYKDSDYLNCLNIFEKWFQNKNKCNIECNTLRMTLFEV